MKQIILKAVSIIVPHGVIALRDRRRLQQAMREQEIIHKQRRRRIESIQAYNRNCSPRFDYDEAIYFLFTLECDPQQAREGSMDEPSLRLCEHFIQSINPSAPVVGLHIGNFVGISLMFFAHTVATLHSNSVVFSIDPNIPHRGIKNPVQNIIALLNHFNLNNNAAILVGYSLEKSISTDGLFIANYNPIEHFHKEMACEKQLAALSLLGSEMFDFVVIDGNHEGDYLARELEEIDSLLKPSGFLFLDDISWQWAELKAVYDEFAKGTYEEIGANGRIGILRKVRGKKERLKEVAPNPP